MGWPGGLTHTSPLAEPVQQRKYGLVHGFPSLYASSELRERVLRISLGVGS